MLWSQYIFHSVRISDRNSFNEVYWYIINFRVYDIFWKTNFCDSNTHIVNHRLRSMSYAVRTKKATIGFICLHSFSKLTINLGFITFMLCYISVWLRYKISFNVKINKMSQRICMEFKKNLVINLILCSIYFNELLADYSQQC